MSRENGGVVGKYNPSSLNTTSGVYNIKTQFAYNASSLWPRSGSLFVGVAHASSPFFSIYSFSSLGFGAKLSDPATLLTSLSSSIGFAPNGKILAAAHSSTPFISAYSFSGSGIGTKYSNPVSLPAGTGNKVIFNPSGNTVVMGHAITPFISAYPIDIVNGFGTRYSDPTSLPAGTVNGVTFNNNGTDLFAAHATSPYITAYQWNNGFSSKYSNPGTPVSTSGPTGQSIVVTAAGTTVILGTSSSQNAEVVYYNAWDFVSGVGFGSKQSGMPTQPGGTPGEDITEVSLKPDETAIAASTNGKSPYVFTYAYNNGFGTRYSDPTTLPAGAGQSVAFDPNGQYLAVAHSSSPYITVYPWSTNTGYGTKISNPTTLPTGNGNGIAWGRV
jgi:hypothetical protein